ncbi:hypothetical protein [Parasphingorhabdus halotolerans]|uniref:Glycerophosphoryl diester phosphodiesterase membrane domain-containing protein n=1 Tax=Parasphingorhabdus halotolerans TaxID=2725558 RepID=A0A6H2DLF1_9SPHN|nr:hypothetical protein [Parasphingorhabdus halotolerans]QJB69502.1 hypothetical protein HF685_09595 [Parasphingorhabdus halotolerans]
MANPDGKVDISRVLNNTFGVISRNPVVFLGLSFLILGIPNALLQLMQGSPEAVMGAFASPTAIISGIVGFIVIIFFSVILQATLIVATVKDLGGEQINLGDCVNKALSKVLPLIGLGFLMGLGIMLGFVLLVVPGVILALMWMVSSPVLMTENKGVVDSMKRSAELTSGSKLLLFLLMIIYVVIAVVIGGIGGAMSLFSTTGAVIVALLVNTITGALQGAGIASIYVDLRNAKEGTDTSTLADVFA